ncbi:MAG: hypothetical protein J6S63_01435 [Atopobiaceae bacterium]|nr:hypothetical protein [Atopobiaceae bacterium]
MVEFYVDDEELDELDDENIGDDEGYDEDCEDYLAEWEDWCDHLPPSGLIYS